MSALDGVRATGTVAPALDELTVVAPTDAAVTTRAHVVVDLADVATPYVLLCREPQAVLDDVVLARILAVLRATPRAVGAIGGLVDLRGEVRWPVVSHLDGLARARRLAEVDLLARALVTGPPCTAVLRTDALVGPPDDLVVHRSLAASEGEVYLHAEPVVRLPVARMQAVGHGVDWLTEARASDLVGDGTHLVATEALTQRPWWDRQVLRAVLAGLRGGEVDGAVLADPSVALVLARGALADGELARAWSLLEPVMAGTARTVEAAALAAEVLVADGDAVAGERLLGRVHPQAPNDLALHARIVQLMSRRPRPPVGSGPRQLLQGPAVLDGAGVEGRTSVVVVTYNSADTIRACLDPLVGHHDIEVVVVDNSPDDGTVDAIADLPVVLRRPHRNLGFAAGCNEGMAVATGEAVLLLNPDAVITADGVRRLLHLLRREDLAAVGPLSDNVAGAQKVNAHLPALALARRDGSPLARTTRIDAVARELHGDAVRETDLLIGFCVMLARGTIERLGGLDPDLFFGNDDLDLSWRITETGGRLGIAKGVFAHHVGHVSALTVDSGRRAEMVRASTAVLANKLDAYYGVPRPSGMALWGIPWSANA